ncbi:MAG: alpha/beta hydrolase, partial [Solirubrobacterales bacterium]
MPDRASAPELVRESTTEANGLRFGTLSWGPEDGPLALLVHGFPDTAWTWRHVGPMLGAAGWHAVAPDMRGYGTTEAPADGRAYTQLHLVGDMVGILDALGAAQAVIVGHDWGAPVAWNSALVRPDRFRAVAGLSVPWTPRTPIAPTQVMKMIFGDQWFYFLYFQEPGKAESELDANARLFLRSFLYTASGDPPPESLLGLVGGPKDGRMIEHLLQPERLPAWVTEADVDFYAGEFERTGFRGGLQWYRCADLSWELTAAWNDARIRQPALFVAGER